MGCGASKGKPGRIELPAAKPVDIENCEKQGYEGFVFPLQPGESLSTIEECSIKPVTPRAPSAPASATDTVKLDVRASGTEFVDAEGRRLTLRGVNLACKTPTTPNGATHLTDGFFETAQSCSFVGRPFPLTEADIHLTRLRAYGVTVVRFIVLWEAIEHEGPGKHDEEYIAYVGKLVHMMAKYGIKVYVDPHQDVWSRFSGGDGAPAWTFAVAGLDIKKFHDTGAALVHQTFNDDKSKFPRMCWPTNMHKLACGTMFTLFWGGAKYAPNTLVDGENIQDYLQRHYIAALARIAAELKGCTNVIGFGTMNEPLPGFLGVKSLNHYSGPLKNGLMPTPFQSFALGSGHSLPVSVYSVEISALATGGKVGECVLNEKKESAWLDGRECIWKQHGLWGENESGAPKLLKPDYFADACYGEEHYLPFAKRYIEAIRSAGHPDWLCFVEMPPLDLGLCKFPKISESQLPGIVHAPHWYDQLTLFLGKYTPWFAFDVGTGEPALGHNGVFKQHARQLKEMKMLANSHLGGVPTLVGEVGIPFDLHSREAYTKKKLVNVSGALDASVDALEANGLSYTLWCYCHDHTEEFGDGWNREDLSVYSEKAGAEVDPTADPNGIYLGGRCLKAFVRPYAYALAGTLEAPLPVCDNNANYCLSFRHDPAVTAPTLIFVPVAVQYKDGYVVAVSDGCISTQTAPPEAGGFEIISYYHDADAGPCHKLEITPKVKTARHIEVVKTARQNQVDPSEADRSSSDKKHAHYRDDLKAAERGNSDRNVALANLALAMELEDDELAASSAQSNRETS